MSTPTEDGHVRLSSIADDILRKTLTFLTPADCTRGPAAALHLRCFELFGTILPPWRLDD